MDIETLQKFCISLPSATEDIKWEHDLVFSIGVKMFCVASLEPPFTCSFKACDDEFEVLAQKEGFSPAPYMARAKWVMAEGKVKWTKKEWESAIEKSYHLVAAKLTKKLRSELGLK